MSINMGQIDRMLRGALGLALFYLAFLSGILFFDESIYKFGAVAIGVVMLLTSAIRICPLYAIFGIKTCEVC